MTAAEVMAALENLGVNLQVRDGRLHVDAPMGALTMQMKETIRAVKADLLELLATKRRAAETQIQPLPRLEGGGLFPLALPQHAFFMLDHMDAGNRAYNVFSLRRIRRPIDPALLLRSIRSMVDRHETLRTVFEFVGDIPNQRVLPAMDVAMPFFDISGLAQVTAEKELARLISRDRAPRFELGKGPLFRIELIRLGKEHHVLSLAMHHIIADAASLDILYAELAATYFAPAGRGLPRPAVQYADFAAWQKSLLESGQIDHQIDYWKAKLAAPPNLLEALGARSGREEIETICIEFDSATRRRVLSLCGQAGVTAFTFLLSVYQLLLSRYSGTGDIPVIVPTAGRGQSEVAGLIGVFVNGLAMRTAIPAAGTLAGLLARVRETVAEALEHQNVSIESLDGLLRQRRDRIANLDRLSKISFNFIVTETSSSPSDEKIGIIDSPRQTSVFDLMLIAVDRPDGMEVKLELRQGLFDQGYGRRFMAHFARLVRATLDAGLHAPLAALTFLEEADLPGLLAPDQEAGLVVRTLDRRQRALFGAGRHPRRNAPLRILCGRLRLAGNTGEAAIAAAIGRCAAARETLRASLVFPAEKYLQGAYLLVRPAADAEAPPIHKEAGRGGEAMDVAERSLGRKLADAGADLLWAASLVDDEAGQRHLVFAVNEVALDPAEATLLLEELAACLPKASIEAAATSPRATFGGAPLAMLRTRCRDHGIELERLIRWTFAYVASSFERSEMPLTISYQDQDRDGGRTGLAVIPLPPGGSDEDVASAISRMREVPEEEAGPIADGVAEGARERAFIVRTLDAGAIPRVAPLCAVGGDALHLECAIGAERIELTLAAPRRCPENDLLPARIAIVLNQLANGAGQVGELSVSLPQDAELFRRVNDTARPLPTPGPAHAEILAQAARTPDATAIRYRGISLTYAELAERVERLAVYLLGRHPAGGAAIGVLAERSEWLPVYLLGILAAGCVYVPIDPRTPEKRRRDMVEQAGIELVLVDAENEADGPEYAARATWLAQSRPRRSLPSVDIAATAYVMFTSGSTGGPKGVAIPQSALWNFLVAMRDRPGMASCDVLLSVTSIGFDISLLELLLPLTVGATLVIADAETIRDGDWLGAALRSYGITTMQATPGTWRLLLDARWEAPPSFKALCGGEAMPAALATDLGTRVSELWNMYGPTETTIWSSCALIRPGDREIAIGTPIANTRFVLLDRWGRPVPVGAAGELHIRGDGLALGYLDEAQTRERFPTAGDGGERQYRTGDLARLDPDGNFVCLGRIDRQVKIRGHRVELPEIEAALGRLPGIVEAAVCLQGDSESDRAIVAYLRVARHAPPETEWRSALQSILPNYMLPRRFVICATLPRLPNGKLDLARLPSAQAAKPARSGSGVESELRGIWRELLGHDSFGPRDSFFDVGGHSLLLVRCRSLIQERLGMEIAIPDLFNHPTLARLTDLVSSARPAIASRSVARTEKPGTDAVAVIGMAGRFPGAHDLDEFWRNLAAGAVSTSFFTEEELLRDGADPALVRHPGYVPAAALLEDADRFDADFFRISTREAELTDPQHRLLLECAHNALEDAGYAPRVTGERVGVFAGVGFSSYLLSNLMNNAGILGSVSPFELLYGNDKDYAAAQLAYRLDLRGPCITVATACSTGLVAIHQACRSLSQGECDMALAGAAKVMTPQRRGYVHADGGILSPDGHCRPFDEAGAGTVFGSGVGVVVLKPYDRAVRDGDPIHAVIRGTSVNNDGAVKLSFTAPGRQGQAEVIAAALTAAGVDASEIGYVETHGTGTRLGDPVEIAALADIFGRDGTAKSCVLGAVKANIGHLDPVAGIAGFIKTALILKHGLIPPLANFRNANPHLALDTTPFSITTELQPWPDDGRVRRAGVSSFGIGGVNAHAVLEQAPPQRPARQDQPGPRVLALSAHTPRALTRIQARLAERLDRLPEAELAAVERTLTLGRDARRYRWAAAADTAAAAAALLRRAAASPGAPPVRTGNPIVFMFPGQGSHRAGMVAKLHAAEPVFREQLDHCLELVAQSGGGRLGPLLIGDTTRNEALDQTAKTQPALFAVEYALAQLWLSWGVSPRAMIGHSLGEYVAGALANVFTLDDAIKIVVARGRLMQNCAPGAMAAIHAPFPEVAKVLAAGCEIAARNSPTMTTVSGSAAAIDTTLQACAAAGFRHRRLQTSHAFHSAAMDAAVPPFVEQLRAIELRPPRIPFISNLTGDWIKDEEATDPLYWGQHLREPVEFAGGIARLGDLEAPRFLEVGPGDTLCGLVSEIRGAGIATASLAPKHAGGDHMSVLDAAAALWQSGQDIDWIGFNRKSPGPRLHLPTYPFEGERHWAAPPPNAAMQVVADAPACCFEPSWKRRHGPAFQADDLASWPWLILAGGETTRAMERGVVEGLRDAGASVLALGSENDGGALYPSALRDALGRLRDGARGLRIVDFAQDSGERSAMRLLHTAQALAREWRGLPALVAHVAPGLFDVLPDDRIDPMAHLSLGLVRSLPLELEQVRFAAFDPGRAPRGTTAEFHRLAAELSAGLQASEIAFRAAQRWVSCFEPYDIRSAASPLRENGLYLVTGGLGGIGFELAQHMVRTWRARLILTGRTVETAAGPDGERVRGRLAALREMGGEVAYLAVPAQDGVAMARALESLGWGSVEGFFHLAGVADGHVLELRDPLGIWAVLEPKVRGAQVVCDLARHNRARFVVLFSSITAIVGAVGQSAYAAANAFLDGLARANRAAGMPTLSIGWDSWRDVGMAAEAPLPAGLEELRERLLRTAIPTADGLALLDRLLLADLPHVVVSPAGLEERRRAAAAVARSSGKMGEIAIGGALKPRPALATAFRAPAETVERRLAALWAASFGIDEIGLDDDFFELGGTSLQAVRLVAQIEEALSIRLSPDILMQRTTVADLAAHLSAPRALVADASPLVSIGAGSPTLPVLILVHPVGGQILVYRDLVRTLQGGNRIYGLRALDGRRMLHDENFVEGLAAAYLEAVDGALPGARLCLAGSSFGGMVAFDMARQLEAMGRAAETVVMIDTPGGEQLAADLESDAGILAYLAAHLPPAAGLTLADLAAQPDDRRVDHFLARVSSLEGDGTIPDRDELIVLLDVFRRHQRMMGRYRPGRVEVPVHFIGARERRPLYDPPDPAAAWRDHCAVFTSHTVPGNHVTLHVPPNVEALGSILRDVLGTAVNAKTPRHAEVT